MFSSSNFCYESGVWDADLSKTLATVSGDENACDIWSRQVRWRKYIKSRKASLGTFNESLRALKREADENLTNAILVDRDIRWVLASLRFFSELALKDATVLRDPRAKQAATLIRTALGGVPHAKSWIKAVPALAAERTVYIPIDILFLTDIITLLEIIVMCFPPGAKACRKTGVAGTGLPRN